MIQVMTEVPSNVAAFRALAEVAADDYKKTVIPVIENLLKRQDKINFLLVLDTPLKNFTVGAFLQDIAVGLRHFKSWRKMAIVSESKGINQFTNLFSYIAPGEAKGFNHAELNAAIDWVSQ